MPLTPTTRLLVQDTCFSVIDFVELRKRGRRSRRERRAALKDAQLLITRYMDVLDPSMGKWLQALIREWGQEVRVPKPIENLVGAPQLLSGDIILSQTNRRHPEVLPVQRALMALAKRRNIRGYMLPQYGADGDYGNETEAAVKVFQGHYSHLAVTGVVEQQTAQTLDQVLRLTLAPGTLQAKPSDIVGAAMELCQEPIALNYGVPYPWINNDPFHAVPVNVPFDFLVDRWKCNLFGGNVLRKAGYEPPFYGNRGTGEYPNANQWQKWSDRYGAANGNKVHFYLVKELQPDAIANYNERIQALNALLQLAQPGDFLMQDHPGPSVADGGHTRVAIANNFDLDGTVAFAQAQYGRSEIQDEGATDLLPSENLWLLRPNLTM